MTDDDTARLETAEETLECIVTELEDRAIDRQELIEQLNDVLDCVQIALGGPYVWLLARSRG